uniref:Uncharacterized protein n=1 Tax=uncultured Caudovirales phage TaxID=2100421 RepID=A0A6J5L1L1_9CAUD|nr:hypothetical protein UFOVP114_59 [uncultured Caudovirales phage]
MDKEKLIKSLVAAGMDESKVRAAFENDVADEDKLIKAIASLREPMNKGGVEAIYTQADMDAAAAAAGSVLEQVGTRLDSLFKGFGDILQKMSDVVVAAGDTTVKQGERIESLQKGLVDLRTDLNLPASRRSVASEDPTKNGVMPSPHDDKGGNQGGDKISKSMVEMAALSEMPTANTERRAHLSQAVSRLGVGAKPSDVAMTYGIKVTVPA